MPDRPLAALLAEAEARLASRGVEGGRLDAEVLLARALGEDRGRLLLRIASGDRGGVPQGAAAAFEDMIARRERREPVAYILGRREFWSLDLEVGPGVLIPRPETEVAVQAALEMLPGSGPAVALDVGTGSGAIALALASERPELLVVAADLSPLALRTARRNAARLGLSGRVATARMDLTAGILPAARRAGRLDLIVSNPPYVALSEASSLPPEVAGHEPPEALFGGPGGLETTLRLAAGAAEALAPGGGLVMESDASRAGALVRHLMEEGLWQDVRVKADLAGLPRVVTARRAGGGR
ncbi:MAG TPA: peptide chain release factor N(5)-glutamine methyltransferase [Candidatus Polarisedimenticolia bacterium]|nr:peptide chain release factor N(5)-glutamine methyltransferase [Candidatus Polarisedimenticolia bacterium]